MAVLIEANSVVLKVAAVLNAFAGRLDEFKALVPNQTLCVDGELIRVGFMTPSGVDNYLRVMANKGLVHLEDGKARDMVMIDQIRGLLSPCDWVEVYPAWLGNANTESERPRVMVASLRDGVEKQVYLPEGWHFEKSLTRSVAFVPRPHLDLSMHFLRHENGIDVYENILSGGEAFLVP